MNLIEERRKWRSEFELNPPDNPYINDYRKNRDSELWRSTRALEQLCEYILFLEDRVNRD